MKIRVLTLACVTLCAACSAPKMAYKFNYHDYNAGRKVKDVKQEVASNPGPAPVVAEELVAMESVTETTTISIESVEKPVVIAPEKKTYEDMSKKERRELRREFKKEIKSIIKKKDGVNSVEATKALDKDLKLAAIFGAVGVVGLILGGASGAFWIIGGIAMLIGVVFFVRWLIRQ
ncbi:MAG TPA: hypothetical protein VK508_13715 [Cyclobacteriaceae bacterium]|nr:hypothetical protein [Cyclobacteriaceae bacterium]